MWHECEMTSWLVDVEVVANLFPWCARHCWVNQAQGVPRLATPSKKKKDYYSQESSHFNETVNAIIYLVDHAMTPLLNIPTVMIPDMYEWSDCANMLLVIDTLRRAHSQGLLFLFFLFFLLSLLPAAELETSSSISRLMNAAAALSASNSSCPQAYWLHLENVNKHSIRRIWEHPR